MSISTLCYTAIVSVTLALMGCKSKLDAHVADPQALAELTEKPAMAITGRSPVIASPGTKVELTGLNFRPVMTLALADGRALDLTVESDTKASFMAPADLPFGGLELTAEQDGVTQTITLVFDAGNTDFPLFNGSADKICQGEKFYDVMGTLVEGTKDCAASAEVAECKDDGEVGCITTDTVRGAVVSGLGAKVLMGNKVAGVDGSAPVVPDECSVDGATGCVATANFPGVDKTKLVAGNIKSSVTIAGVAGTVVPRPADCAADGEVGCVTISTFKAAKLANFGDGDVRVGVTIAGIAGSLVGAPAACASDGETACLANASFKAAATAGLADKVLSGQTVAATAGNVTLPAVGKVLASIQYGVAGTGSTGTLTLPAAGNVLTGSGTYGDPGAAVTPSYSPDFPVVGNVLSTDTVNGAAGTLTLPAVGKVLTATQYGVAGTGSTGTLTLPAAGNVLTGSGTYGDPGAAVTPSYSPDFPAVGNVLSTDTVNGSAGTLTLPAVGKVLASIQYGVAGTGSTGTLTLPAASNVLTGSGTYGDPGAAVTPTYSPDFPSVGNVLSTDTVNGSAGTLTLPAASNVLTGSGVYGVAGTGSTPSYSPDFPAVGNVLSTDTVNGSAGTLTLPAAADVRDSVQYGVAGTGSTGTYLPDLPDVANVRDNDTVGGAAGTLTLPAAGNVLASTSYGSAGTSHTGTLTLPAAGKVLSGSGTYGVAGTGTTPTLTLPAAGNVLTGSGTYGDPGAAVTPSYSPDFPAVGNVISTDTVNGSAGTLTLPAVGKVLASIQYGVAGTGSTGTLTLPAAGDVLTGSGTYGDPGAAVTPSYSPDFPAVGNVLSTDTVNGSAGTLTLPAVGNVLAGSGTYGVGGTGSTPTLTLPTAANVRVANGDFGVGGTGTTPTLADCASDGAVSCVVDNGTNYKAAASAVLLAGNIKRGTQIGGVTGNFPSATSPLPRYSDDGATTNTTGVDETDLTNFQTQLKTDGTFEFWASSGVRMTGAGDSDIVNANVVSGIDFENLSISGSAAGGSNCTGDGQTGCVTTSRYKSMDTDASVISTWDIRKGKTAGGLAGDLVFYKNMVGAFNRTAGTGAHASQDIYDTVDDYNNNGAFPTTVPTVTDGGATVAGWYQATGANWLRDSASDDGAGGGTASDGICNGSEACVYKDQITGLFWAQADATTRTWETAITYCDGLSYGTYTDWRLPTQKELMQAYTDGVWSQKDAAKLNLAGAYYWSSSTLSGSPTVAWIVDPRNGGTNVIAKTTPSYRVLCVR